MRRLMKRKASEYGLPFEVVAAVVYQESKGNPWASRVEEKFYVRYVSSVPLKGHIPTTVSNTTERWHRATSWGLMQIMGQTARDIGFDKECLTRLLVPIINLEFGCRYLAKCFARSKAGEDMLRLKEALAAYNTGRTAHELTQYDEVVIKLMMSKEYEQMFE